MNKEKKLVLDEEALENTSGGGVKQTAEYVAVQGEKLYTVIKETIADMMNKPED